MSPPRRSSSSSSSNLSALLSDADPKLAALHSQRLAELQASATSSQPNTSLPDSTSSIAANAAGYGSPGDFSEALAIRAAADASRSLLLFSHAGMAACSRMRGLVDDLSRRHPEVCCIVVNAEESEWLAGRMSVRVLPVLVGLKDGNEVGRVVGFEGLKGGLAARWRDVETVARGWGVIDMIEESDGADNSEEDDGRDSRNGMAKGKSIRTGNKGLGRTVRGEEEDSDWD